MFQRCWVFPEGLPSTAVAPVGSSSASQRYAVLDCKLTALAGSSDVLHHHVLIPCDCLTSGRTLVTAKASSTSKVTKAKEPAPQAENPTLALTEEEPAETPGRVDSGILEGGVTVALLDKDKDVEETGISSPEDYWTPIRPPPGKGEYTDQYGTLSPVPQHDGTDCLKTDDTLWTHAEHFKVTTTVFDASVQTFC